MALDRLWKAIDAQDVLPGGLKQEDGAAISDQLDHPKARKRHLKIISKPPNSISTNKSH